MARAETGNDAQRRRIGGPSIINKPCERRLSPEVSNDMGRIRKGVWLVHTDGFAILFGKKSRQNIGVPGPRQEMGWV